MSTAANIDLSADRMLVESELESLLEVRAVLKKGIVREAMYYAVFGNGKRIRPVLAIRVARFLRDYCALTLRAAAAVELLHCASLIVDDLPCMDNAMLRRNRPSVHAHFGEATAILAAFGLVALAARSVIEQCPAHQASRAIGFQLELLRTIDSSGLLEAQAMDLRLRGQPREDNLSNVNELKTIPLFQLAVRAGVLCPDLPKAVENQLSVFGRELGKAFQMRDDILDGESTDIKPFLIQIQAARECLFAFGTRGLELEELLDILNAEVRESIHSCP